jgi:hypothetical protein
MKAILLSFLLLCGCFSAICQYNTTERIKLVSYKGILSGDYHNFLEDNEEYRERSEHYREITSLYDQELKLVDSLERFIKKTYIPTYFKIRASHIVSLVKNNATGDVYKQIRIYGIDFALVLNDIVPIIDLYRCERMLISSRKELRELESWAKNLAAVSEYFNHLFIGRKLNQPLSYYTKVQSYDKEIDAAFKEFKKNGHKLNEQFYPNYETMFSYWQTYEEELQLGKNRDAFFQILEKKYGNSLDKNTEK